MSWRSPDRCRIEGAVRYGDGRRTQAQGIRIKLCSDTGEQNEVCLDVDFWIGLYSYLGARAYATARGDDVTGRIRRTEQEVKQHRNKKRHSPWTGQPVDTEGSQTEKIPMASATVASTSMTE